MKDLPLLMKEIRKQPEFSDSTTMGVLRLAQLLSADTIHLSNGTEQVFILRLNEDLVFLKAKQETLK